MIYQATLAFALSVGSFAAFAGDYKQGDLSIEKPWARMTIKSRPAAGYMKIHNMGDQADKVVSASSPMAERIELHTMTMNEGVMRMRKIDHIEVPAKSAVELKSGGLHLMIFGLKHDMKPGATLPISVTFEKAGKIDMAFKLHGATGKAMDHGDHSKHGAESDKKMDHGDHSGHSSSTQ